MKYDRLDRWIGDMLADTPLRANSLIITVFGDAISPHGGTVWLGSLIDLLAPLGINDRAVRTSVYRLAREAWLHASPIGRRSVYQLTESGQRRIHHAYRRIYDTPRDPWNGEWLLVIIPEGTLPSRAREDLRRDLLWEGYGAVAPGVFALPAGGDEGLDELLVQNNSRDKVVILSSGTLSGLGTTPLRTLVHQCWHLDRLADDYRRFAERFAPTLEWIDTTVPASPEQCFVLRTLLIHEFRRIQLRDPQLPDSLLADDWPGHAARQLCQNLYAKLLASSEQHLLTTLKTPDGALPDADASLYSRFGGISFPEGGSGGKEETAKRSKPRGAHGAPGRNRTNA